MKVLVFRSRLKCDQERVGLTKDCKCLWLKTVRPTFSTKAPSSLMITNFPFLDQRIIRGGTTTLVSSPFSSLATSHHVSAPLPSPLPSRSNRRTHLNNLKMKLSIRPFPLLVPVPVPRFTFFLFSSARTPAPDRAGSGSYSD